MTEVQNESNDHGDAVFVFIERITPIEERADDVLEISIRSVKAMRGQPGLLQTLVTKPEKSSGEIVSVTTWENKAAFQAFMKTDVMAELLKSDDMANIKKWMKEYNMHMNQMVDGWHP